jgi:hypothetical protein
LFIILKKKAHDNPACLRRVTSLGAIVFYAAQPLRHTNNKNYRQKAHIITRY